MGSCRRHFTLSSVYTVQQTYVQQTGSANQYHSVNTTLGLLTNLQKNGIRPTDKLYTSIISQPAVKKNRTQNVTNKNKQMLHRHTHRSCEVMTALTSSPAKKRFETNEKMLSRASVIFLHLVRHISSSNGRRRASGKSASRLLARRSASTASR